MRGGGKRGALRVPPPRSPRPFANRCGEGKECHAAGGGRGGGRERGHVGRALKGAGQGGAARRYLIPPPPPPWGCTTRGGGGGAFKGVRTPNRWGGRGPAARQAKPGVLGGPRDRPRPRAAFPPSARPLSRLPPAGEQVRRAGPLCPGCSRRRGEAGPPRLSGLLRGRARREESGESGLEGRSTRPEPAGWSGPSWLP